MEDIHTRIQVKGAKMISVNDQETSSGRRKSLNVNIRQMGIDDLPSVFHLGEKIFTAREVPNLYRTWDEYGVIDLFQGDPEFCLVAEWEEEVIGFALGTTVTKRRSAWKYGHLVWLGTDPKFQGCGIATKLFHDLRDLMLESGVRIIMADTEADNEPALKFFEKLGFGNPEEQVYLALNLESKRRKLKEKRGNSL